MGDYIDDVPQGSVIVLDNGGRENATVTFAPSQTSSTSVIGPATVSPVVRGHDAAPVIPVLFAFWPFTRLVHVFSAPLGYVTRPYIVYRSRDDQALGSHATRRGWERVDR